MFERLKQFFSKGITSVNILGPIGGGFYNLDKNGRVITPEDAIGISALLACVRAITEVLAQMPAHVYFREDKNRFVAEGHPVHYLIHTEPHELYNPFYFKRVFFANALIFGFGLAHIERDGNYRPSGLRLYHPYDCQSVVVEGKKWWKIRVGEGSTDDDFKIVSDRDVLYLDPFSTGDGSQHTSLITLAANAIGLSMSTEDFASHFFNNKGLTGMRLEFPHAMKADQVKSTVESVQKFYSGKADNKDILPLATGVLLKPLEHNMQNYQFEEIRNAQIEEIARVFRVPPHIIGHLAKSSFNNITQQSLEYLIFCLQPYVTQFEQEFNRKMFSLREKGKYYLKMNVDSLLRMDPKSRSEYIRNQFYIGMLSQNDGRELEDRNPIDGGDEYYTPLNLGTREDREKGQGDAKANPPHNPDDDSKNSFSENGHGEKIDTLLWEQ